MLRRLLPLLLLAALVLPRGARLVWCVCFEPPESACCAGCCCPSSSDEELGAEHESDCCLALEVEDFEEILAGDAAQVPGLVLLAALRAASPALVASPRGAPVPACNGPPHPPPAAGLLAGVRPLRI